MQVFKRIQEISMEADDNADDDRAWSMVSPFWVDTIKKYYVKPGSNKESIIMKGIKKYLVFMFQ